MSQFAFDRLGFLVESCQRLLGPGRFAFSIENWKRPHAEVKVLMSLLKRYLRLELDTLLRNNIRFRIVGRYNELPDDVRQELSGVIAKTAKNTGMLFNIALNYGGRAEIVDAARKVMESDCSPADLDEQRFAEFLYTGGQPDPDLLIRTSGEMRVSNFLLWQVSYSEMVVTQVLWPEFRKAAFFTALEEYAKRRRRFGKI
mgnify:CR=1 FL=1